MEALSKLPVPARADILQAARNLVPLLQARRLEITQKRMVPADVMGMIADAGLMQLARPAIYGGREMGMDLVFEVTRILAQGDGSTAWVYAVGNSHDQLVGLYPKPVQDAYWASAQPLCASSYQPSGKAVRVDGGYRLTGKWSFCSGIDHCGWIVIGAILGPVQGVRTEPDLGLFLFRKGDIKLVDDWHVMGLAGTGSKSVVLEDTFVSDEMTLFNADVRCGQTPGALVHKNPMYRTSIWTLFGFSILAPITGIVRGAYEAMVADFRERAKAGDPMFESKRIQTQMRLAEAAVLLEAAELLYERGLNDSYDLITRDLPISDELRTRNRRDQAYLARLCRQSMDHLMAMAGGRGIREEGAIQSAMRDVFAISAHPGGNWDAASASFGSVALGGPPTEMFC